MTDLGFIVKMVIYRCRELGNPVTETLAAYVAQTTLNKRKSQVNVTFLQALGNSSSKGRSPRRRPKNSLRKLSNGCSRWILHH